MRLHVAPLASTAPVPLPLCSWRGRSAQIAVPLALALLSAPAEASPPPAAEPAPFVAARSRLFLRLDPASVPDPDGRIEPAALGSFRIVARAEWEAEAAGWLAHAPGAASYADDAISGDVTALLVRRQLGPGWFTLGRHWTTVGGLRLEAMDGATAGLALTRWLGVAVRGGLAVPTPGEVLGDTVQLGAEARARLADPLTLSLGVLHGTEPDTVPRTRWTTALDWFPSPGWSASAAATADVQARALVEARAELSARPADSLRLRGYGHIARPDQLLAADELLAVFSDVSHQEAGALAEWSVIEPLRLRLDGAALGTEHAGGRIRAAVDVFPAAGTWTRTSVSLRTDREGRTGTLRLAARWPFWRTVFGTVEALGDARDTADEDPVYGGLVRTGAGFEPYDGWFVYGALEGARTPRWPERLGGLVLVEHALGAPVRWGGTP